MYQRPPGRSSAFVLGLPAEQLHPGALCTADRQLGRPKGSPLQPASHSQLCDRWGLLPFSQGRSPPSPHKFPLCQPVTFYLLNPPTTQRNTSIWKKLSTASLGSGKGPLSKEQVKSNREHQCLVASAHAPVDTREDVHMVLS